MQIQRKAQIDFIYNYNNDFLDLKKKYNKICEKIEQLNEDAFNIEKELMYRHNEENN